MRAIAKSIIGDSDFIEIYINAPLEICEARDKKDVYARSRRGEIKESENVNFLFEPPDNPSLEIRTDELTIDESAKKLFDFILPYLEYTD